MTTAVYTPSVMPRAALEAGFVVRQGLLDQIVERVDQACVSTGRHHTLVIGSRGAGKTHLVALAYHRIRDLMAAGRRLHIAWLPEDPWTIQSYRALLASILDRLEPPAGESARGTAEELEARLGAVAAERGPVVVLVENLAEILDHLDEVDQQRLRRLLQADQPLLLVATSTGMRRHVADPADPLYGFFSTTRLAPFTIDEARLLLQTQARQRGETGVVEQLGSARGKARLQAVAHLTGGHARVWVALSRVLTAEGVDSLVDAVLLALDDLSASYRDQVAHLSGTMRLVLTELAESDHPVHVAELAGRLERDQHSLAKTIFDLVDRGWLRPFRTPFPDLVDRRRTYYEIAHPVVRLTLQLRAWRGHRLRPVLALVRDWFDSADTAERHRSTGESPLPLLGALDDALSALARGNADPCLSLSCALRGLLDERLTPAATRTPHIFDLRLDVHRRARAALTYLPAEPLDVWLRRAQDVAAAPQAGIARLTGLAEWLTLAGKAQEADIVLTAVRQHAPARSDAPPTAVEVVEPGRASPALRHATPDDTGQGASSSS